MHSAASRPVPEAGAGSTSRENAVQEDANGDAIEGGAAANKLDELNGAEDQLVRRWSAPSRRGQLEAAAAARASTRSLAPSAEANKTVVNYGKNRSRCNEQETSNKNNTKSISSLRPTSSSASDSAFSRSQTTLGTDSETTLERFSLGKLAEQIGSSAKANNQLSSSSTASSAGSLGDNSSSGPFANPDQDEHFKIIWQNLSYEIPEKRLFSQLASIASKIKAKWTGTSRPNLTPNLTSVVQTANNIKTQTSDHSKELRLEICKKLPPPPPPSSALTIGLEEGLALGGGQNHHHYRHHRHNQSHHYNNNHHHHHHHLDHHHHHHQDELKASNRQRDSIFSNLNGYVESGQLTAILGPSGAGKTTFLKCLTNGITKGVSGSITIHNKAGTSAYKSSSQHLKLCIIPQKDYLFDNLTVMENLLFASRIKNTQTTGFDHKDNVFRIANLLGLTNCLRLKTSRLSGGQYKRVSIAQELLSQPDILILDEPTSGLDSLTCFRTVSVLRDLADMSQAGLLAPLAIIMTIHQPQVKIFNLFHHVYVLSSLGQCVYEGRPESLIDIVAEHCQLLPPPDDQNPASFIIDLASEVYGQEPIDQLMGLHQSNFSRKMKPLIGHQHQQHQHQHQQQHQHQHQQSVELTRGPTGSGNSTSGTGELVISEQLRKRYNHEHSFWLHINLLIRRLWISSWRDSLLTTTRITFHLLIPFVFYFVYSQKSGLANACPHVERELDIKDMVSESNIERLTIQHDELILTFENVSLFFLLLYSFSMCVLAVTALSFPLNMQILLKETNNGWYTMPRFVMAKTLADLPMELTMPMISVSIAYALTGQPSSTMHWRMLSVTAIMTCCSLISQTQGLLFGAYFMNNVQAAVFISQASTLPWIMLSGFTTRVSQLPLVLQWLSFGSIYRLGIESIVAVRYGYGMCPCDNELVTNTPAKIVGIPDQVRSLMSYYLDMYSDQEQQQQQVQTGASDAQVDYGAGAAMASVKSVIVTSVPTRTNNDTLPTATTTTSGSASGDIFSRIASTLVRANTYGANIVSCNDVRPFIMSAREVDESTLPWFMTILILILLGLRILLFFVVRFRTG